MLNGALMIVRRTLDGALKWALRDFRRAEWRTVIVSIWLGNQGMKFVGVLGHKGRTLRHCGVYFDGRG